MADPIRTPGGDRVRYGERDAIGVEGDIDPEADQRGINGELSYLRRQDAEQIVEHDGHGVHSTPKIPRAVLIARWVFGQGYRLHHRSYLLGTYGSDVATLTDLGSGDVQIDLADTLNTVNYGIEDMTIEEHAGVNITLLGNQLVCVRLLSINDDTSFTIRRYAGAERADLKATSGDFQIAIFAE